MCGICGLFGEHDKSILAKFSRKIAHRGPDSKGKFYDKKISLGVRRLSIIDLKTGNQPIYNEEKDKVIVFNGEIYNYKRLRNGLEEKGHEFATESDTETILHLYEEEGPACFKLLEGQFAVAIYDLSKKELVIARDSLGIKPIFFYCSSSCFYFSSEIKAFFETDAIPKKINLASLMDYEVFNYPLFSSTLLNGIYQLPPGRFIKATYDQKIRLSGGVFYHKPTKQGKKIGFDESLKKASELIEESVLSRFNCSDVGVGIELSGGLDSSLICQILSKNKRRFNTYCIDQNQDSEELKYAKKVAEQTGASHNEWIVSEEELTKRFPEYIYAIEQLNYDGFFHHILSSRIKKDKVLLCGQGADEVFGSYGSVLDPKKYLMGISGNLLSSLKIYGQGFNKDKSVFEQYEKIRKIIAGLYRGDLRQNILNFDQDSQLRNFMLLVDRALFFGKEVRVPYLNLNLVGFVNELPMSYKVNGTSGKVLLKGAARLFGLDDEIIRRKKVMGPDSTKEFFKGFKKIEIKGKKVPNFSSNGLKLACLAFNEIFIENNGKLKKDLSLTDLI